MVQDLLVSLHCKNTNVQQLKKQGYEQAFRHQNERI